MKIDQYDFYCLTMVIAWSFPWPKVPRDAIAVVL